MAPITIVNTFLLPCIITILVFGILLNLKYTQKNIYRGYLLAMLTFWAVIMLSIFIKFHADKLAEIEYNRDLISVKMLLLGIPCFLTLIGLPLAVLNTTLLRLRSWVYLSIPLITVTALYFGWHYMAHEDPFKAYLYYQDMLQDITSISLILRALIVITFLSCILFCSINTWRIVPLYNKYIEENIANSDYNVEWIKSLFRYIILVSTCYFVMLFSNSPYVNCLYLCSLILLFSNLIVSTIFYKTTEGIEPVRIKWKPKKGWYIDVPNDHKTEVKKEIKSTYQADHIWCQFNEWMLTQKPYIRIDFTINDVLQHFPNLTHDELTSLIKSKGETFQSLVRKFRIKCACEIIEKNSNNISSKQVFSQVGFSHYSSFSRSFVSVMNISPSDYIKKSREQQNQTTSKR